MGSLPSRSSRTGSPAGRLSSPPDDPRAEHEGMERMRAHVRGIFDQAATDAARAAGDVAREGRTTAYDDLRDDDRVRMVYAYGPRRLVARRTAQPLRWAHVLSP